MLEGSGLCGVWSSSTSQATATGTVKKFERYRVHVDGTVQYSRKLQSWTAESVHRRNDEECDKFIHETTKGTGTCSFEPDGKTIVFSCPVECCLTVGGGGRPPRRTTSNQEHVVQMDLSDFKRDFAKFVEVSLDAPALQTKMPARTRSLSAGRRGGESRLDRQREMAKLSIRLGDYAKARRLLEETGDREGAVQLLRDALEAKIRTHGQEHAEAAKIADQLQQVQKAEELGNDGPVAAPAAADGQITSRCSSSSSTSGAGSRRRIASADEVLSLAKSPEPVASLDDLIGSLRRNLGVNKRKLDRVAEVFKEWDVEGVGHLSRAALATALRRVRPLLTDADIDQVFAAADANKDGALDLKEFTEWFLESRSLHKDVLLSSYTPRLPPKSR